MKKSSFWEQDHPLEELVDDTLFWKYKQLDELTSEEWSLLCSGCGACCIPSNKDGEFNFVCKRLNCEELFCTCFDDPPRGCRRLSPDSIISDSDYLPDFCGYRCVNESRDLPSWHPLLNDGSHEKVIEFMHKRMATNLKKQFMVPLIGDEEEPTETVIEDQYPEQSLTLVDSYQNLYTYALANSDALIVWDDMWSSSTMFDAINFLRDIDQSGGQIKFGDVSLFEKFPNIQRVGCPWDDHETYGRWGKITMGDDKLKYIYYIPNLMNSTSLTDELLDYFLTDALKTAPTSINKITSYPLLPEHPENSIMWKNRITNIKEIIANSLQEKMIFEMQQI